jgi:uncharacterized protein YceK
MKNKLMTRILLLLSILLLSGCGETERPRFIPSTGDAPRTSPSDRQGGDKASRETTIPKNIPTH